MSFFYRIKGIPGFEGLIAESDEGLTEGLLYIKTILNSDTVIGDRTVKFPIPPGALAISADHLFEMLDPSREYSASNPFGTLLFEGRFTKEQLEVVTVKYENALTITIIEKNDPKEKGLDKTLYTQNFFKNREKASDAVDDVLHDLVDVEDLIFKLKELKSEETN